MCRVMTICEFRRVCGILPRTTYKKGGGFGVGAPTPPVINNERRLRVLMSIYRTMPCAWPQDVAVKFGAFCGIIKASFNNPINQTDLYRAGNAMQALTIVTLEVN